MKFILRLLQFLIVIVINLIQIQPIFSVPIPSVTTFRVLAGETVQLSCLSNDINHRFQFWRLENNQTVGPQCKINRKKYRYEVLSGALFIKAVSRNECGIYTCYSKHLRNSSFNAKSIKLVVKSNEKWVNWQYENITIVQLYGIFLCATIITVVLCVLCTKFDLLKILLMNHTKETVCDEQVVNEVSSIKIIYQLPTKFNKIKKFKIDLDNKSANSQTSLLKIEKY